MTNQSGTTGPSENSDIPIQGGPDASEPRREAAVAPEATVGREAAATRAEATAPVSREDRPPLPPDLTCTAYESHGDPQQVTLRTPAELADAVPYLLGYRPEDSMVLVSLHDTGGRGRFGGRARLGIPADPGDWPSAARQLAQGLVTGSERRGSRPEQMVLFLCREPGQGETGRQVKERLGPLAQALRLECGALDVPVIEALCISDGRFWSYCCDDQTCCPVEGTPMGLPGTSVLAAAAAYAGVQVRGSLRALHARLQPWETSAAHDQRRALDEAALKLLPRIVDAEDRKAVADETMELAERLMRRLADAPPVSGTLPSDLRDDELITYDEAALVLHGLQDRPTRDRAAAWMEGDEAAPALRLWRTLARRCVGPYGEYAAAPLTLAGWVAWSSGDELEAREALAMALGADPDYLFARLLHQACNEGLDPESIRRCLRGEGDDEDESEDDSPAEVGEAPGHGAGEAPERDACRAPDQDAGPAPRRRRMRASGRAGRFAPRGSAPTGRVPRPRMAPGGARPGGAARPGAVSGRGRRQEGVHSTSLREEAEE
ncbi:DUF4192 domain-containing protein [Streptomyces cellulosae]|uniref:DUF4192 domain-containing protein n=2 Tax=Streptomyces TaxID=1883 RepID=A0ABU0K9W5_9ACTN|nr:hypothetical protein [Streptomyces thermodiastaticus]UVT12173.1 DUF4192 domain-containing protein [Streptomyces thermocarboxydus]WSB43949.1 DUF4192 domain-containing protein [Streptomyces cellulosae]WTF22953.1 DUF4192 domain-containing protein [Streptomyces cellulosae]